MSSHYDKFDNWRYSHRVRCMAKSSWKGSERAYACVEAHLDDFKHGYIDGYVAVSLGKSLCPPVLPPKKYWSTCYSNPRGKVETVAWFDGYHHGVTAAISDGMTGNRRLVTSGDIYNQYRPRVEFIPEEAIDRMPPGSMSIPEGEGAPLEPIPMNQTYPTFNHPSQPIIVPPET